MDFNPLYGILSHFLLVDDTGFTLFCMCGKVIFTIVDFMSHFYFQCSLNLIFRMEEL